MTDTPPALALLLLIAAPAAGSFLGVLIDRLPRGEDVIRRRSACRSCAAPLGPADLIPVLSYLWRRGRCGRCGAAIPRWLPGVELGALALAGLALAAGGPPGAVGLSAVVLWCLLALALCDLQWFQLPDALTGALFCAALGLSALYGPGWAAALWGASLGSGAFLALRAGYRVWRGREGLGLGDVKLMAGLGALAGPYDLPLLVLLAALAGLAAALAGSVVAGRVPKGTQPLPFGAALAASGGVIWLLHHGTI